MATRAIPAYRPFLKTLRRLPDDVVKSLATRDLELGEPQQCLLGWAMKETLAAAASDPDVAEERVLVGIINGLHAKYGGTYDEWHNVYYGVVDYRMPNVEEAFARRVAEAVAA